VIAFNFADKTNYKLFKSNFLNLGFASEEKDVFVVLVNL